MAYGLAAAHDLEGLGCFAVAGSRGLVPDHSFRRRHLVESGQVSNCCGTPLGGLVADLRPDNAARRCGHLRSNLGGGRDNSGFAGADAGLSRRRAPKFALVVFVYRLPMILANPRSNAWPCAGCCSNLSASRRKAETGLAPWRATIRRCDLYFQTPTEGWSFEECIVKSGSFDRPGVGVRAIAGEKRLSPIRTTSASRVDAGADVRTMRRAGRKRGKSRVSPRVAPAGC